MSQVRFAAKVTDAAQRTHVGSRRDRSNNSTADYVVDLASSRSLDATDRRD